MVNLSSISSVESESDKRSTAAELALDSGRENDRLPFLEGLGMLGKPI